MKFRPHASPSRLDNLSAHACRAFGQQWNSGGLAETQIGTAVGTMASRLGASLERLCILGYNMQFRRKPSFVKLHTIHPRPLSRNLINQCQVSFSPLKHFTYFFLKFLLFWNYSNKKIKILLTLMIFTHFI